MLIQDTASQLYRDATRGGRVETDAWGAEGFPLPASFTPRTPGKPSITETLVADIEGKLGPLSPYAGAFDGMLTKHSAIIKETETVARNMVALSDQMARYLASSKQQSGQRTASLGALGMLGGHPAAVSADAPPTPPSSQGAPSPLVGQSFVNPADERGGHAKPEPAHTILGQDWKAGRHTSLKSLRTNVADNMAHNLSEWNFKGTSIQSRLADGSIGYTTADGIGHYAAPGTAAFRAVSRNEAISSATKGIVQRVGGGATMGEAIGGAIPMVGKALGVAGAAYTAANWAADFAENQRKANNAYQKVLGGDNTEGFGERASEKVFEWSQRGVMGGEDAAKLYKGTMSMFGKKEGKRREAQAFGTTMYRQHGMDVEDSLRLIEMNASKGVEGLGDLAKAIEGVTKAARDGGVNADEARKRFEKIYAGTSGGPGGATTAGALSGAQSGMGHAYEDWDFGGMTSTQQMRMTASSLGVSYGQLVAVGQSKGGSAQILAKQEQMAKKLLGRVLKPAGKRLADAYIKEKQKTGGMAEDLWRDLAIQVLMVNGVDPQIAFSVLTAFKLPHPDKLEGNEVEVVGGVLQLYYREHPLGGDAAAADASKESSDKANLAGGERNAQFGAFGKSFTDGQGPLKYGQDWSGSEFDEVNKFREEMGIGFGEAHDLPTANTVGAKDRARNLYVDDAQRQNKRNAASEHLVKDQFDEGHKFVVKTKDGFREVNTDDLIRHFQDQLVSGDVFISQGSGKGQSVSEYLGYQGKKDYKAESASKSFADEKYAGEATDKATGSFKGQKVEIPQSVVRLDLTPEFKKWFDIQPGSPGVSTDQRNGTAGSSDSGGKLPSGN